MLSTGNKHCAKRNWIKRADFN